MHVSRKFHKTNKHTMSGWSYSKRIALGSPLRIYLMSTTSISFGAFCVYDPLYYNDKNKKFSRYRSYFVGALFAPWGVPMAMLEMVSFGIDLNESLWGMIKKQ